MYAAVALLIAFVAMQFIEPADPSGVAGISPRPIINFKNEKSLLVVSGRMIAWVLFSSHFYT